MAVATEKVYEVEGLGEVRARKRGARGVEFVFEVGTRPGREGVKRMLAVVSVSHSKAGPNYFNGEHTTEDHFDVVLRNEEEEVGKVFTSRGFMVGSGVRLTRFGAGNRYSAKKLRDATDAGFAFFKDLYESGSPEVRAYFADGGKGGGDLLKS